jgi:hypothetical protein
MLLSADPGWAIQAGGTSTDVGEAVAVDGLDNAYLAGRFSGAADLNGDGSVDLTSGGDTDGFVAKYSSDGTLLWASRVGGPSNDVSLTETVRSVAVGADEAVYITGVFAGTAEFGGPGLTLTSQGEDDVFVAKLDPATGGFAWVKRLGGNDEFSQDVVANADGVFVTGYFNGTADFGPFTLTASQNTDVFVTRLDPATGDFLWARRMGGTGWNGGNGLALDGSGNLYVTGYFRTSGNFGGINLTSNGYQDIFVARLQPSDGSVNWAVNMGGTTNYGDEGHELVTDSAGNLYVTGQFSDTARFGAYTLTATGSDPLNAFAAKLGPDGSILWARQLAPPTEYGNGLGIAIDRAGTLSVTGVFGTANLARLDTSGNIDWSGAVTSPVTGGRDIAVDADGLLYVPGAFREPTDFDTGDRIVTLTPAGSHDSFLLKRNPFSPGFKVSPTSGLETTESGGQDSFSVALTTQPTADVTITVSSGNTAEGTVSSTNLTFTPTNWDVPQTVTVTGSDDSVLDGDVAYTIVLGAATSADPSYNGLDPADVSVTNPDIACPGRRLNCAMALLLVGFGLAPPPNP